jgi:uncharacterized membrane protein
VTDRIEEVGDFYRSTVRSQALNFLERYNVEYIVVGQLEQAVYPGIGLKKFEQFNGDLWQEVYRDRDTVIYQVRMMP